MWKLKILKYKRNNDNLYIKKCVDFLKLLWENEMDKNWWEELEMKNIIKKICSLLALIMIILNSSVLTTLSMAIDEISTNVTANVSNDKKEKVKIYTSYIKTLLIDCQMNITITGILEKDTEDCALYENPVVYFEFPAEIEKVVVNDIKVLYDNELKLKDYTIEKNDVGNQVIKVSLEGKQTQYSTDGISQGTNIRIVANVIANKI